MKKRILTIFLIMILAVTNLNVCYASGIDDLTGIGLDNYEDYINSTFSSHNDGGDAKQELKDNAAETGSGIIKLIMNVLAFIPKLIVNVLLEVIMFIIPCMDDIVFNDKVSLWGNFFRLTYFDSSPRGLAGQMVGFVSTIYQMFRYVALIGFVVAIAVLAVKMIMASIGKKKQQYKESLKAWLIGLVLLIVGHWIMIYTIYFSELLVDVIVKVKDGVMNLGLALEQGGNGTFDLVSAFSSAVGAAGAAAWGMALVIIWAIGAIVAIVIFIGMNLKIVKVYLERVIIVGVLIMIFPLVTVLYAFEKGGIKKGSTFESWLRTFIDQVFIQPVHALTLLGVCVALNAISNVGITAIPIVGMILVLMVLNTMFTIENVIKRVFAINGASLGAPVNPMGAAMAGVGMAAPMIRGGNKAFKNAANGLKAKNPNASGWQVFKEGNKAFRSTALDSVKDGFSVNTKYGRKNISGLSSMMGLSLPQEVFDVDKLSYTEQQTERKRSRRAAIDLKAEAGVELNSGVKNLRNMMDPDIEATIRRKCGLTLAEIDKGTLTGDLGDKDKNIALRKYMQMMSDPNTDVSDMSPEEFNYYTSKNDSTMMRDLEKGKELKHGKKVDDDIKHARKKYMVQNSDKAEEFMRDVGLDEAKIKDIEEGKTTVNANDVFAYELFLRKCGGVNVDAVDCKDGKGNFDADTIHNIQMSESSMQKKFEAGRSVESGKADAGVTTARKVFAATQRKKYEKILKDSGLSDNTIRTIESGGTASDEDILAYKVMIDRCRTGNDLDKYTDVSDNLSEALYNGNTMDEWTRTKEATDIINDHTIGLRPSSSGYERGRSVLQSCRMANEEKLYRCSRSAGVDVNEIINYIDGRGVSKTFETSQVKAVLQAWLNEK